jgi:hypothetical protein
MNEIEERFPTRDEIEQRAYEIYLERGEQEGDDLNDWYAAERELTESGRVLGGAPSASLGTTLRVADGEAGEVQTEDMEKMIEEMYERSRAAAAGAEG